MKFNAPAFMALLSLFVSAASAETPATPSSDPSVPKSGLSHEEISKLLDMLRPPTPTKDDARAISQGAELVLTPETITAVRLLLQREELAWQRNLNPPSLVVKPQSLEVGALQTPIVLAVRNGYPTFVEFYDSAGRAWPTQPSAMSVGSSAQFEAVVVPDVGDDMKSHMVRVSAKTFYGDSTLSVHLEGVADTVNFRLVNDPESKQTDFKRIITLPMINTAQAERELQLEIPQTPQNSVATINRQSQDSMLKFMSRTPPSGAILIPVIRGSADVWLYQGDLYALTQYETLQYPRLLSTQSLGGSFVHKMKVWPRLTYFSKGRQEQIELDDEFLMSAVKLQNRELEQSEHQLVKAAGSTNDN